MITELIKKAEKFGLTDVEVFPYGLDWVCRGLLPPGEWVFKATCFVCHFRDTISTDEIFTHIKKDLLNSNPANTAEAGYMRGMGVVLV